jgi:hypothetical protein
MLKFLTAIFQLVSLVVVTTWSINAFHSYLQAYNVYNDYKKTYDTKVQALNTLKAEIVKKTDPYEIEKNVRNNLNLGKEGEKVAIINTKEEVLGVATKAAEMIVNRASSGLLEEAKKVLQKIPFVGSYIQ